MVAGFTLFIEAEVHALRDRLPGNLRQRVRHAITELAVDPFPPHSRLLDTSRLDLPADVTIRRVRLEQWRLIYAVHHSDRWVWVLGLHRRPPYDYQDLPDLVHGCGNNPPAPTHAFC